MPCLRVERMRLELTGRHVDITPGLRRLVTSKLSKLERMLNHRAVSAQAVLSREKHSLRADITLQAKRVKSKFTDRKRRRVKGTALLGESREALIPPAGPPRERVRMPRILRATRQTIREMSVADATRAIDVNGDGLVIFRDVERASVSVLYRRNGELTLVEIEA